MPWNASSPRAFDFDLTDTHAAIIAGGLGTRAAGMTADRIPKALLPVGGVPIIFRQMRVLRREGVTRVSVLAGHLGDQLRPALEPEAAALGLELADHCRADAARNRGLPLRARSRARRDPGRIWRYAV